MRRFRSILERRTAEFASWYELFPRSQSGDPNRHGTFDDVVRRLPAIRDMGFDVVYFPPIHPIGKTNRKGRNNALKAGPDDPGSPYAIGSDDGGHDAIHPALGTFDGLPASLLGSAEARSRNRARFRHPGLSRPSLAASSIPNGSPGGPTGRSATRRIRRRNTRTSSISTFTPRARSPRCGSRSAIRSCFWVDQGVRLFRVDNPHTKPFPFWDWLIDDIRREHPDVIFLARGVHPAEGHVPARQGRLLSKLHLFHLAQHEVGADRSTLTELTSEPLAGFLPAAFLRQYARHQSGLSAECAASGLSDPRRAGRDAVRSLGGLQWLRALRRQARLRRGKNMPTAKNTKSAPGTGTGPAISSAKSPR